MYHFHFKYNEWSEFWTTVLHRLQPPPFATSPKPLDISCCLMLISSRSPTAATFIPEFHAAPKVLLSLLEQQYIYYYIIIVFQLAAIVNSILLQPLPPSTIRQPGIPTDMANLIDLFISSSELMRAWTYRLTETESWQRCAGGTFLTFLSLSFSIQCGEQTIVILQEALICIWVSSK